MDLLPDACLEERERIDERIDPNIRGSQLFLFLGEMEENLAILLRVNGFPIRPRSVGLFGLAFDVELLVVRSGTSVLQRGEIVVAHFLVVELAGDGDPTEPLGDFLPGALLGEFGLALLLGLLFFGVFLVGVILAGEEALAFFFLTLGLLLGFGVVLGHAGTTSHHATHSPPHSHTHAHAHAHAGGPASLASPAGEDVGVFLLLLVGGFGDSLAVVVEFKDRRASAAGIGDEFDRGDEFRRVADQARPWFEGHPRSGGLVVVPLEGVLRLVVDELFEAGILEPVFLELLEDILGGLRTAQVGLRRRRVRTDFVVRQRNGFHRGGVAEQAEADGSRQGHHDFLAVPQAQRLEFFNLGIGHEGHSFSDAYVEEDALPMEREAGSSKASGRSLEQRNRGTITIPINGGRTIK